MNIDVTTAAQQVVDAAFDLADQDGGLCRDRLKARVEDVLRGHAITVSDPRVRPGYEILPIPGGGYTFRVTVEGESKC